MAKSYTLSALAEALDAPITGDGAQIITRLAHPADTPQEGDLVLAMDKKLLALLEGRSPAALIVAKDAPDTLHATGLIRVPRPRLAIATLTKLFDDSTPHPPGIHPTAIVENGAKIGKNPSIGAYSVIASGAIIGDDCVIYPQVYVGPHASIGDQTTLYSGVRIGENVTLGARAIIHFNATLGADGFSYVTPQMGSVEAAKASGTGHVSATNNALIRIASLGGLVIGDDVEIGANTTLDRGTIQPTRIGNGTKIDNQVQIGHNVVIGDNCLVCGRVGIAGSAIIGNRVVLGGAVGVADHVIIGDDAVVMAMSGVAGNVPPRSVVGGIPATSRERMMENHFNLNRLKNLFKKVETLEEQLAKALGTAQNSSS